RRWYWSDARCNDGRAGRRSIRRGGVDTRAATGRRHDRRHPCAPALVRRQPGWRHAWRTGRQTSAVYGTWRVLLGCVSLNAPAPRTGLCRGGPRPATVKLRFRFPTLATVRMSQRPVRILTGITTSGTPHLGNYVGAIRPAIAASRQPGSESFYFLADLHSLIKAQDPARTQRSTLEIAATWLAAGLEPDKVWFYRQSDVPEISELTWYLTCVAGKGILNRAHAYKAAVDRNRADGEDDDAGVTAGLFMYPVLMAADI